MANPVPAFGGRGACNLSPQPYLEIAPPCKKCCGASECFELKRQHANEDAFFCQTWGLHHDAGTASIDVYAAPSTGPGASETVSGEIAILGYRRKTGLKLSSMVARYARCILIELSAREQTTEPDDSVSTIHRNPYIGNGRCRIAAQLANPNFEERRGVDHVRGEDRDNAVADGSGTALDSGQNAATGMYVGRSRSRQAWTASRGIRRFMTV
ncbi:hypothetical protein GQ44DRAFT_777378 [Phaeosphaeriaceae sp. PMI808]|nr:hypothetical protein GQ44DRAFT_777378 [Phaeosphaeriaceae sp. PMI808]